MPVGQDIVNQVASLVTGDPELFVGDPGVQAVQENDIPNHQPTARVNGDPLISALTKVHRLLAEGELPNGYTGPSVVQQKFGLDEEELANLRQKRILENSQNGWGFGRRYEQYLKQFSRSNPVMTAATKANQKPASPTKQSTITGVMSDFDNLLSESKIR